MQTEPKRNTTMPKIAKTYIATIAAAGFFALALAGLRWSSDNLTRFAALLFLALLASGLKIRLPGFTGTVSANFVFILVGIAVLSFSETTVIGFAGALAQSLWKMRQRPKPVQILFNVACLAISSALAYTAAHFVSGSLGPNSLVALMALGACFYLVLNTGLVSLVVALAEERPLRQVWRQCYEWVFPYFLVGSAVAGLASGTSRSAGWTTSLLTLPSIYFVYLFYRMHVRRAMPASIPDSATEEELLTGLRRH
jgi:hypothetical protein